MAFFFFLPYKFIFYSTWQKWASVHKIMNIMSLSCRNAVRSSWPVIKMWIVSCSTRFVRDNVWQRLSLLNAPAGSSAHLLKKISLWRCVKRRAANAWLTSEWAKLLYGTTYSMIVSRIMLKLFLFVCFTFALYYTTTRWRYHLLLQPVPSVKCRFLIQCKNH